MSAHFARSLGIAVTLQLAIPITNLAAVQGLHRRSTAANAYQISVVHDRLTDSSLVTALFTGSSRPFGLRSRAWLDLSFSFVGARLMAQPRFLTLTIESWTPSRGGWAFAHPESLHIRSGDSLRVDLPPAGYLKRPVHLFDSGRREALWFAVPSKDFTRLAGARVLLFSAGRARFKVRERMEMFRELARRMTPSAGGLQ